MPRTKRFSDQRTPHPGARIIGRRAVRPPRVLARRVDGIRNTRAGLPARSRMPFGSGRVSGPGRTASDLRRRPGHFPARARSVIMLMQVGGPSQIDLFDPKPELRKRDGQVHSQDLETLQPGSESKKLMASPFRFRPHGAVRDGALGTDPRDRLGRGRRLPGPLDVQRQQQPPAGHALPALAARSSRAGRRLARGSAMRSAPRTRTCRPMSCLRDPDGYNNGGTTMWESGWLPAIYQGTEIQSRGAAVLDLHPAVKLADGTQRNNLDALARLNEERRKLYPHESVLDARIRNYELAARMQLSAEEVLDIRHETAPTRRLYGLDDPVTANFGTRCLMARRLVESGVRFIQVMVPVKSGGMPWDHHENIKPGLEALCPQVDVPTAALIRDLKQRGLLDSTIVLWTGEFGRLPISQTRERPRPQPQCI